MPTDARVLQRLAFHHQAIHRRYFDAAFAATEHVVRRDAVVLDPVSTVSPTYNYPNIALALSL
jgi:hypothetical protein